MTQAGTIKYLIANWKSHKNWQETEDFLRNFPVVADNERVKNIVCPPLPFLIPAVALAQTLGLATEFGVQDVSPFPYGAYTGAVAAPMLSDWVSYAIVGHSERRRYFGETHADVANKVSQCLTNGIQPVVCVDEPYIDAQLAALDAEQVGKLIFAYEPLEAIGSGIPDTPEHAQKIATQIQEKSQENVPVLYGGSVTPETAAAYLKQTAISGVLVGGASLDVDKWKGIVSAAQL